MIVVEMFSCDHGHSHAFRVGDCGKQVAAVIQRTHYVVNDGVAGHPFPNIGRLNDN